MRRSEGLFLKRTKELESLIDKAQSDIDRSPEGTLNTARKGAKVHFYWCQSDEEKAVRKYIRNEDVSQAVLLAQKEYAKKIIKLAEEDRSRIDRFRVHDEMEYIDCLNDMIDVKRNLVTPYLVNDREYAKQWMKEKEEDKALHEGEMPYSLPDGENAIITEKGEIVRSKSEKILADKFFKYGIPYVYELPLHLRGYGTIYPDFTLLNVHERRERYWEHMGLMDNADYCSKAISKIETYEKNHIFPGEGLLLTFETKDHLLNIRNVDELIREYFLR